MMQTTWLSPLLCRWVGDLVYVHGPGGGNDELSLVMRDFDPWAPEVQLPLLTPNQLKDRLHQKVVVPQHLEPAVPYRSVRSEDFSTTKAYDFICLTRLAAVYTRVSGRAL